jgi:hypothetical protein
MFYVMIVGVVGSHKNLNVPYAKKKQDQKHLKGLFLQIKFFYFNLYIIYIYYLNYLNILLI